MKIQIFIILITTIFLVSCSSEKFEYPDIKDDFCGVHINYQFCKCAFHNKLCDNINMDKKSANKHVNSEYDKWVDELLAEWLTGCAMAGGIPGIDDCTYCDEELVVIDGECALPDEEKEKKSDYKPDGPLNDDCSVNIAAFEKDWRKYSDIDDVIPVSERSYEAKQALGTYETMIEKMLEAFALERDIEIENQMQVDLEEYRSKLVNNIRVNLLKSFWRLSWVTYSTIQSSKGLGKTYSEVLTTASSAETVGKGLKLVQGLMPGSSALAINTSTVGGKAMSVGANTALEAIESLGDPTKIATELFKSASMATLPSADISPQEIAILRTQHIDKGLLDTVLANSRTANADRQAKLAILEADIISLQTEIGSWEGKEKERVKSSLEASCLLLKKQYEQE